MGFLQNLMMKLFGGAAASATKEWEEHMTLEQLDDLEKQGCDVTEYRKKYFERQERNLELQKEKAEANRLLMESIDLSKLAEFMNTPRDAESSFVKDTAALNKMSKSKTEKLLNGKLVYAAVLQAHSELWQNENVSDYPKGVVFVISTDEKRMHDQEWLLDIAAKLADRKTVFDRLEDDNTKLLKSLKNDTSMFCHKVGASLVGDSDTWCGTLTIDNQKLLPNSCLPPNKILPMILMEDFKEDRFMQLEFIPASYFTK